MITLHYNDTTLDIQESDTSYRYRALMEKPQLVLKFSLPEYIEFPVGTWCEYQNERYTVWSPQNIKKNGERNIEYTITMGNDEQLMAITKLRNSVDNRLKFSMCAKPHEFIEEIVKSLNKKEGGSEWTVGTCIDSTEKTVEFNHSYIDAALQSVADTFETEWEIVNKKISLHKVEYFKEDPLPLSYGKGNGFIPGLGRTTPSGEMPIKRLYVQGGDKNIDRSEYGSAELLLPKGQTLEYEGRTYKSDDDGLYIERIDEVSDAVKEDSLDCSEIYPSRVGTVSSVECIDADDNFYDFLDSSIPSDLNFNDYIIEGETATVIFQSGMLAGKEFEFKYKHAERRFELVPQEIDGQTMPNDSYKPVEGDTYAVFGIMLPDDYICNNDDKTGASWDMFREAARHLYENEDQKFTFTGTLQGLWAKRNWLTVGGYLKVGGYILFSDTQFAQGGIAIRITGIKDFLYAPYSPTIEISNSVSGSSVASQLREIANQEVVIDDTKKSILQFTKRRFRDAQETLGMLEKSLLNFSSSVNPITVQTMAMLVGDESLQFRFVESAENLTVDEDYQITYDNTTKQLHCPHGFLQHMTLGISSISSSHGSSEYKVWEMSEYLSPVLTEGEKKYYLYAQVSREDLSAKGTFFISENAIDIDDVDGYYHLLVGVLNSELEEERSYVDLYGYTEVLPGRITTDKIVSTDGNTYFDLVNGVIAGIIHFRNSQGELEDINTLNSDLLEAIGSGDEAALDSALEAISAFGETIIEGGYIRTELIDASAIRTSYLEIETGDDGDLRRITATPDNMAIDIYDEDGDKCTTLEGLTHYSLGELFGDSSGDCSIIKSSSVITGIAGSTTMSRTRTTETDISSVWYTDTPTQVTLNSGYLYAYAVSAAVTTSSSTTTPQRIANASVLISIRIKTYSDEACTNLISTEVVASLRASASSSALGASDTAEKELNLSGKAVKTSSGGYHKLILYCSQTANLSGDQCSAKYGYDKNGDTYACTASYKSDFYVSRYFANGFCLGERSDNYILGYKTASNGMRLIMENNGFGIDLSNIRPKIKHNGGNWLNMPLLLFKGRGVYASSAYTLTTHVSWNGKAPTISRNDTGDVSITYPESWSTLNLGYANTIVHVEGNAGTNNTLKATVYSVSSTAVRILLADDASANDGEFLIDLWLT